MDQYIEAKECIKTQDDYRCDEYTVSLPSKLFKELKETAETVKELEEENKKLKYVIDLVMEKADIEYIRLSDGDVFTNPKNKLHISDTIQIDILNHKQ